jgi:hypothetical protein
MDYLLRASGHIIESNIQITGTGALTANVLQFTGTVLVLVQWAELTTVTTLTNATNVYATAYDGTNSINLTADGATLSGYTVGSFFTKDQDPTQTYTVHNADQVRMREPPDKRVGKPFFLTGKNGVTNYIRFHLTTTDNPVDFIMKVHFEYEPMNGGTLQFV